MSDRFIDNLFIGTLLIFSMSVLILVMVHSYAIIKLIKCDIEFVCQER